MDRFREVDPGDLYLPPPRASGADPFKLAEQIRRFGDSVLGMPPVEVTEARDGALMINDGVTRATRIAKLRPGDTNPVEVIDRRPGWSLDRLHRVREML